MRALIALGGNAMTGPGGSATPVDQDNAVSSAMEHVADLIASGIDVVLTHGNGPQVGNLLVKNELAAQVVPPVPLDWCGAQTQGTIGFLILDSLDKALAARGVDRRTATVVTRTLVDGDDPGFTKPDQADRPLPARGRGEGPHGARPDLGAPRRQGLAPGRRLARAVGDHRRARDRSAGRLRATSSSGPAAGASPSYGIPTARCVASRP